MTFNALVIALCDRFVSQRAFDLIVTPAMADLEFEEERGRHNLFAGRAAVLRAVAGGIADDMRRGSGSFLKLAVLSVCYYLFPIAVTASYFKTWSDFFVATTFMLALALSPVVVCFWPGRHPVRHGD